MISSDFRTDARRKLDGKWGKKIKIRKTKNTQKERKVKK